MVTDELLEMSRKMTARLKELSEQAGAVADRITERESIFAPRRSQAAES
jgi:hypothetical protein